MKQIFLVILIILLSGCTYSTRKVTGISLMSVGAGLSIYSGVNVVYDARADDVPKKDLALLGTSSAIFIIGAFINASADPLKQKVKK